MNKDRKKAHVKEKKVKEDMRHEPELEMTRMVSMHNVEGSSERRRSSFKDIAKKIFSKDRKHSDDANQRKRSPSQMTHRSFKSIMNNLFHPHRKSSVLADQRSSDKDKKQNKKQKKDKKDRKQN